MSGAVPIETVLAQRRAADLLLGDVTSAQVWQLPGVSRYRPEMLSHLTPELTGELAEILGARRLRVLQDVLICKPPGAPEVPWHTDISYTGFLVPPRAMSVRLSLVDTERRTGCLSVLDRSHSWAPPQVSRAGDSSIAAGALEALPGGSEAALTAQVDVPLRAGDITLHHCRTWHMSHPNLSTDFTRKTIVVHVFDAQCGIDPQRVPEHVRGHIRLDELPLLPSEAAPRRS